MWDLPGPGLEPVSSALAGRSLTTAPPGKPSLVFYSFTMKQITTLSTLRIITIFGKYISFKYLTIFMCWWGNHPNTLSLTCTCGGLQTKRRWRCVLVQRDIFSFAFVGGAQHVPCIHETIKEIMWCYLNIYKYPQRIIDAFATFKPMCYMNFQCLAVITDTLYCF